MECGIPFEIENNSDCSRHSAAVDTFGVSTIFIWNAPGSLSSAIALRKLLGHNCFAAASCCRFNR